MNYSIIILIVLLLVLLPKKNNKKNKYNTNKVQDIKTLIRQASRWSIAAQQDESPLIALLHANYGAGYLWALKDIASDREIYEATGINVLKFKKKIIDIQDGATKKVSKMCPQFIGDGDIELLQLAGDI